MPQIIVQAHTLDGAVEVTLAERTVPTEQQDDHYLAQLIDRLGWAVIVAERLESRTYTLTRTDQRRANAHLTSLGSAVTPGITKNRLDRTLADVEGSR